MAKRHFPLLDLSPLAIAAMLFAGPEPMLTAELHDGRMVDLGQHTMAVPVPEGYCPIDRDVPAQDYVASEIEALGTGEVRMLAFDVDCPTLEAFTGSGGGSITPYVIHYVVLDGDRPATFDGSREAFVRQTAEKLDAPALLVQLDTAARDVDAMVEQRLETLDHEADSSATTQRTEARKPLGHDENAVYIGFVSRFETETGDRETAGVTGVTLVDGMVTTVNMYGDYRGEQTLKTLLKQTQAQVESLVAANRR